MSSFWMWSQSSGSAVKCVAATQDYWVNSDSGSSWPTMQLSLRTESISKELKSTDKNKSVPHSPHLSHKLCSIKKVKVRKSCQSFPERNCNKCLQYLFQAVFDCTNYYCKINVPLQSGGFGLVHTVLKCWSSPVCTVICKRTNQICCIRTFSAITYLNFKLFMPFFNQSKTDDITQRVLTAF